jgi:hypothetical protein
MWTVPAPQPIDPGPTVTPAPETAETTSQTAVASETTSETAPEGEA